MHVYNCFNENKIFLYHNKNFKHFYYLLKRVFTTYVNTLECPLASVYNL